MPLDAPLLSLGSLICRWEWTNHPFGDFEKFLRMGDLHFGLFSGHFFLTTVVARDPQILGINEDTIERSWYPTSIGEVLSKGGNYSGKFGERHSVTFKKSLCNVEHRVVPTRSGYRRKPVCQKTFRGGEAVS